MTMSAREALAEMGYPVFTHENPPEFVWPCGRRVAHGPHVADDASQEKHGVNHNGDGLIQKYYGGISFDCPGVKAHPDTQIGGRLTHG